MAYTKTDGDISITLYMKTDYSKDEFTETDIVECARVVLHLQDWNPFGRNYIACDVNRQEYKFDKYKEYTCNMAWYGSMNYMESTLIAKLHNKAIKLVQELDNTQGYIDKGDYTNQS